MEGRILYVMEVKANHLNNHEEDQEDQEDEESQKLPREDGEADHKHDNRVVTQAL